MKLTAARICLLVAVLTLVCPCGENHALAFDVGGFRTGMDRNDVALALKSGVRVRKVDPSSLLAIDNSGNESRYDLCNGSLVSMELPLKPDFSQFVSLVREYTGKYGQPVSAIDSNHPLPRDAIDAVGLRWKVAQEYVSLYFSSFSAGDRLTVFYQAPNSCYQFPR